MDTDMNPQSPEQPDHDDYDRSRKRVVERWQDGTITGDLSRVHWMASEVVRHYLNRMATGSVDGTWLMYLIERYARQRMHRILVLGCGDGWLERSIAAHPLVERIDAFDVAEGAVERARAEAKHQGLDRIHYGVMDLNRTRIPTGPYEIIIAHSVIHHVENLDLLYDGLHAALVPDGLLLINEYVGPKRFQFSDRQISIINRLLLALPEPYRQGLVQEGIYPEKPRPTEELMIAIDPSEAVRSDEIVSYTERHFTILETLPGGGTILMQLLYDVVQNFDHASPEDRAMLELLCRTEELMLRDSGLPSDYLILAASHSPLVPRPLPYQPSDPFMGGAASGPLHLLGTFLNRLAPARPILGPPGAHLEAIREGQNLQGSGTPHSDWIDQAITQALQDHPDPEHAKLRVLILGNGGEALAARLQAVPSIRTCTHSTGLPAAADGSSYDLIYSLGSLGSAANPQAMGQQLRALLAPRGLIAGIERVGDPLAPRGRKLLEVLREVLPREVRGSGDLVSRLRTIKAEFATEQHTADELKASLSRGFGSIVMQPLCSRMMTVLLASCAFPELPCSEAERGLQRLLVAADRVLMEENALEPAVVQITARGS